jgi:hypothetical protein
MELLKEGKSLGDVSDYTYHATSLNSKSAGGYRSGKAENTPDTMTFKTSVQLAPGKTYELKDGARTFVVVVRAARALGKGVFWVTAAVDPLLSK